MIVDNNDIECFHDQSLVNHYKSNNHHLFLDGHVDSDQNVVKHGPSIKTC